MPGRPIFTPNAMMLDARHAIFGEIAVLSSVRECLREASERGADLKAFGCRTSHPCCFIGLATSRRELKCVFLATMT
jgi:hypothetical protein